MNIHARLRKRTRLVTASAVAAFLLFICATLMVFIFSPRQALLARRIDRMPVLDATAIQAARPGAEILVAGRLQDNPVLEQGGFVAYTRDEWRVTPPAPDDDDNKPTGSWTTAESVVPDLTILVKERTVRILRAEDVTMSGALDEKLIRSDATLEADHDGKSLPNGTQRIQGMLNGDLITVLGKKASTGGVIPTELFAGDRVAFAESKRSAARGLLYGGLCLFGLAPAVLVGGVLGALFWRRRRLR
jgi:hypothetical protein